MSERAIGVNETVNARLQLRFARFRARRRTCDRAISLRQVAQLEAFVKRRPTRVHRLGILLPSPIILLD